MKKILTEVSGSLVASYILDAIKEAGYKSVASDIRTECFGNYFADEFITVPSVTDPQFWHYLEEQLTERSIDCVLPSFDGSLLMWAERKKYFAEKGVNVIVSPPETVAHFQDKWSTYEFFTKIGLPCAKTSLSPEYPLVKPRLGSGAKGIFVEYDLAKRRALFDNQSVSQEVLEGTEYTVDCLFDANGKPCYIVPRKRMNVISGKSVDGVVEDVVSAISCVKELACSTHFIGPVNIQLFLQSDGSIKLVEVNPRIAGGMALSFAATENWVRHFEAISLSRVIETVPIQWGKKMFRAYQQLYV